MGGIGVAPKPASRAKHTGKGQVSKKHDASIKPAWLQRAEHLYNVGVTLPPREGLSCFEEILQTPPLCQRPDRLRDHTQDLTQLWPNQGSPHIDPPPPPPPPHGVEPAPGAQGAKAWTCCGCHNNVSVNPNHQYKPVEGPYGEGAHHWCEALLMAPHQPGAPQGFATSSSGAPQEGALPEVPVWKQGLLRLPVEYAPPAAATVCCHGFAQPKELVQFCLGINAELSNPKVWKGHKKAMAELQGRVCRGLGECHKKLHEPQAAIAAHEHHLAISRQFMDKREQSIAYGNLAKAHYSRAAKSKPLTWQEKRDEDWARKYHGRFHTIASEGVVAERMGQLNSLELQREAAMDEIVARDLLAAGPDASPASSEAQPYADDYEDEMEAEHAG